MASAYGWGRFIFAALLISLILTALLVSEWEVGETGAILPYMGHMEKLTFSVHLGLMDFHVRGDGVQEDKSFDMSFPWHGKDGSLGFGYDDVTVQHLKNGLSNGIPQPVIWILEYIVMDKEGMHIGRFFRIAGWYSGLLLKLAIGMVVAAYASSMFLSALTSIFMMAAGSSLLLATLIWTVYRNKHSSLEMPLVDSEGKDIVFKLHFGYSFWMMFTTGAILAILGSAILALSKKRLKLADKLLGITQAVALTTESTRNRFRKKASHAIHMFRDADSIDLDTVSEDEDYSEEDRAAALEEERQRKERIAKEEKAKKDKEKKEVSEEEVPPPAPPPMPLEKPAPVVPILMHPTPHFPPKRIPADKPEVSLLGDVPEMVEDVGYMPVARFIPPSESSQRMLLRDIREMVKMEDMPVEEVEAELLQPLDDPDEMQNLLEAGFFGARRPTPIPESALYGMPGRQPFQHEHSHYPPYHYHSHKYRLTHRDQDDPSSESSSDESVEEEEGDKEGGWCICLGYHFF